MVDVQNDREILVKTNQRTDSTGGSLSSQLAFWFVRRSELDFQNSSHGGHPGFPIGTI